MRRSPVRVRQAARPEHDGGDVDAEESVSADERRQREREERGGQRHHGVETTRPQARTRQHPLRAVADRRPASGADHDLAQHADRGDPDRDVLAEQLPREQHRQDHRDGIVDPRLHLERAAHAMLELDAGRSQHREHRRGVGRRDDRAEEERRGPGQAEPVRDDGDDAHRADDADGREQAGRRQRASQRLGRGVEPSVEQDERQRRRARAERELIVVERRSRRSLRSRRACRSRGRSAPRAHAAAAWRDSPARSPRAAAPPPRRRRRWRAARAECSTVRAACPAASTPRRVRSRGEPTRGPLSATARTAAPLPASDTRSGIRCAEAPSAAPAAPQE